MLASQIQLIREKWRELLYACILEVVTLLRKCGDLMWIELLSSYSRKKVESELIQLFPDIARKGLKLKIWYLDDLAGEVSGIFIYISY